MACYVVLTIFFILLRLGIFSQNHRPALKIGKNPNHAGRKKSLLYPWRFNLQFIYFGLLKI